MHTNLSKRLLAGLMSVVMVLSLIAVAPTTEAKAESETLTIDLGSSNLTLDSLGVIGGTVSDLATIFAEGNFTSLSGDFDEPEVTVSDSTGVLDDDDVIGFGTAYTVNVKYVETEKGAAAKVKRIKIEYSDPNTNKPDDSKTLSKVSGDNWFAFSYKFKAVAGEISSDCVAYAAYGLDEITAGVKKNARTSLISDASFKASARWQAVSGNAIHPTATTAAKAATGKITFDEKLSGFDTFEKGNLYLLTVSLTATSGYEFAPAAANAGLTNAYGTALLATLKGATGNDSFAFVGYTADTKNFDDITLYYSVEATPTTVQIGEATTLAPTYYYNLASDDAKEVKLSAITSAAGLSKTWSVKDVYGNTVKYDVKWTVGTALEDVNGTTVIGTTDDVLTSANQAKKVNVAPNATITFTGALTLNTKASNKFVDYSFAALGVTTPLTTEVAVVKNADLYKKTLTTPKLTWKDSSKKWRATSNSDAVIEVDGTTTLGGNIKSGENSEELDKLTYVKGFYNFTAHNDGTSEKLAKYAEYSGTYYVFHNPTGVDETIKDGEVEFEIEGNPVVGKDFDDEDAVSVLEASSSDDYGYGSGYWYSISPSLAHDCISGTDYVAPGTTYTVTLRYYVGRADDEIGNINPSKWTAYLNGETVTAKTGTTSYANRVTSKDGNKTKLYGNYFEISYTFEKTTKEIASATGEKALFVNAAAPTVGQNVANSNITVSDSTSKYVTVGETKWMDEEGNVVTGQIEDEKTYTATVTLTVKDGFAFGEDLDETTAIGANDKKGAKYIDSVEVDADANTVTLTYSYSEDDIDYDHVKNASDATIKLDAGASYDDIMNALADVKATINFDNGGSAVADAVADADKGAFATQWDKLGYVNTYVEGSDKTQTLTFYGAVDLTPYETDDYTYEDEAKFVITVKVGAGTTLTIDANGGNITVPTSYEVEKDAVLSSAYTYVAGTITKAGYAFAGFYDAAEGGNRVYLSSTKIDKDTTIYAHWTKVFTGWTKNVKAASYSAGRLTVSWDVPVTGAAGYQVRIATSSDMSNATVVGGFNKTVKYYTALKTGTRYYVQVRAYRNDSTGARVFSAWSTTTSAVVK